MLDRFLAFTQALRDAGVPVAISESIDALEALGHVSIDSRGGMSAALAASMLKTEAHRPAFDTMFDLYFGTGRGPEALEARDAQSRPQDDESFAEELSRALAAGDGRALSELARQAVGRYGRTDSARDWYSNYEVVRALDLDGLFARLLRGADEAEGSPFDRQIRRDEIAARMSEFRRALVSETRRRVAEFRGPEAVARYAVQPLPEDLNFLSFSADMAELRRALRPLARKLATRIAMKRRRARRGQLDIRNTLRHSLSTGGVPFEPRFRHRVPHRPELCVLCDLSSSVARFARFSLMLTHALGAQFSRVRSFAFVDTIDEVTRFFEHDDFLEAVETMNREAGIVQGDGHSDYGTAFQQFWDRWGAEVGPNTTLLILGDARNNYRRTNSWILKELKLKVRHVYWLNPEPKADWDTGDSVASEYTAEVDLMTEIRNLKQLEEFIAREL